MVIRILKRLNFPTYNYLFFAGFVVTQIDAAGSNEKVLEGEDDEDLFEIFDEQVIVLWKIERK